jgi:hypothetical protein
MEMAFVQVSRSKINGITGRQRIETDREVGEKECVLGYEPIFLCGGC